MPRDVWLCSCEVAPEIDSYIIVQIIAACRKQGKLQINENWVS